MLLIAFIAAVLLLASLTVPTKTSARDGDTSGRSTGGAISDDHTA